ncbi:hypothetical protein EDC18_101464 [Natranaerovirga pectinivora]|uniref:Uncharacterized protein n=1 Tax=Natranaerovirga pectinivora TaxID=682400 RepID=A0A4R3MV27_9FIRM|nr:hypothetical protein [Natranaerovirga pectinivora]TCT17166.1 hypothetical protein EDC18_101464 [Natranaerovirga pectinivora]
MTIFDILFDISEAVIKNWEKHKKKVKYPLFAVAVGSIIAFFHFAK